MNRMLIVGAGVLLLMAGIYAFGDIPRPKVSPPPEGKVVLHTGLTITADPKLTEARLQITRDELDSIRRAMADVSMTEPPVQRIMHGSTSTVMAGLFMFLAASFAGVWIVRTSQRRHRKIMAAAIAGVALLGAATVIVRANAGPPGYARWRSLPENLRKGEATDGGLDIEIVPGEGFMKLVLPLRDVKKPGE